MTSPQSWTGVRLRGRIDRLDGKEGERKVYDYKTQSDQLLRNKLKEPGEDVQLACYAYAEGASEAAFVSIENGKVRLVAPPHDIERLAQLNAERLVQVMARIREGAGLPANGVDGACQHCEVRGVCRKGEWGAPTPALPQRERELKSTADGFSPSPSGGGIRVGESR